MGGRIAHYKTIDIEVLKKIVEDSFSVSEVIKRIGYKTISGSYKYFKIYLKELSLQADHFRENGRRAELRIHKDKSHLLCANSPYQRSGVKNYIRKNNLIKYECNLCDSQPI